MRGGRGRGRGRYGGGRGGRGGPPRNPNRPAFVSPETWNAWSEEQKSAHRQKRSTFDLKESEETRTVKAAKTALKNSPAAGNKDNVEEYSQSLVENIPSKDKKEPIILVNKKVQKQKVMFAGPNDPIAGAGQLFGSGGAKRVQALTTCNRRITSTRRVRSAGLEE